MVSDAKLYLHDQDIDDSDNQNNDHQALSSISDIAQILTGYSFLNSFQSNVTNNGQVTTGNLVTNCSELLELYLQTAELRITDIIRDYLLPCNNVIEERGSTANVGGGSNGDGNNDNGSTSLYHAIYFLVQALQHVVINVYALFLAPINMVTAPSSTTPSSATTASVTGNEYIHAYVTSYCYYG